MFSNGYGYPLYVNLPLLFTFGFSRELMTRIDTDSFGFSRELMRRIDTDSPVNVSLFVFYILNFKTDTRISEKEEILDYVIQLRCNHIKKLMRTYRAQKIYV